MGLRPLVSDLAHQLHSVLLTLEMLSKLKKTFLMFYAKSIPVFILLGTADEPLFCASR